MGRPPLTLDQRRDRQVNTRFTRAEIRALEEGARARKMSVTAFVRAAALEAAGQPPGPNPAELGALIRAEKRRELLRIGNNLNQIARALNILVGRERRLASDTDVTICIEDAREHLGQLQKLLAREAAR